MLSLLPDAAADAGLPGPWQLLKWYLTLATLHVSWKVYLMYSRRRRRLATLADVPGRYVSPADLVANMGRMHDWRLECTVGSGAGAPPLYKFASSISPDIELFAMSGEMVRHFLKTHFDRYTKDEPVDDYGKVMLDEWLGPDGIFNLRHGSQDPAANRKWRHQRDVASHIFTKSNFRDLMHDAFIEKGRRLINVLDAACEEGREVDMQQKFFAFTMDAIMGIFFGRDADTITLGADADVYASNYDEAHRQLLRYIFPAVPILILGTLLPWPFGEWHVGPLGGAGLLVNAHRFVQPDSRAFGRACRTLTRESHRIIAQRRRDPQLSSCRDLLALFMNAKGPDGKPYSDTELRDIVMNFVIAGRDTTACTLTWALFILATHPSVQSAVCEEIDAVAGDEVPGVDGLSAQEMPYLNGVVYETLRLYPPVPEDGKRCVKDDELPDGTRVRKGVKMVFCPYSMGRDPSRWPEPLEVRPERWIPFSQPDPFDFPVFQAGPRICLGMNMAIFEAKLLLVMLLRRFTFTLRAGEEEKITYSRTITMALCNSKRQDSHNLWLRPRPRDTASPTASPRRAADPVATTTTA